MHGSREEVYGHVASLLWLEEKGTVRSLGWELGVPVLLLALHSRAASVYDHPKTWDTLRTWGNKHLKSRGG